MVQTSWRVAQAATEKRNMSIAVRRHTDVVRKQVGDVSGLSSSDEKTSRKILVNRRGKMEKRHSQAQVR
jgi:hypothetical protein